MVANGERPANPAYLHRWHLGNGADSGFMYDTTLSIICDVMRGSR